MQHFRHHSSRESWTLIKRSVSAWSDDYAQHGKAALKNHELVPEANVKHASVKDLIAQVKDVEPEGDEFDAKIKVMAEYVKHHVKEEQNEMFPKAKGTKLDMKELGAQMAARKEALLAAMPA